MKKNKLILIVLGIIFFCINSILGQSIYQSKIYIEKDYVIAPVVTNNVIGTFYYTNIDERFSRLNHYLLPTNVSDFFDYKIKYCVFSDRLLTTSLLPSSTTVDGKPIRYFMPRFVDISFKEISDFLSPEIDALLDKGYVDTYFKHRTRIDLSPFEDDYFKNHRFQNYFHDFSSTDDELYLTYYRNGKLNVWKYKIVSDGEKSTSNDAILLNQYIWEKGQNFYTVCRKNKIFLFTEFGEIYSLGKEMKKINTLPNDLVRSAIIYDKSNGQLYFIDKEYLNKQLSFSEMLEKFAKKIDLVSKE